MRKYACDGCWVAVLLLAVFMLCAADNDAKTIHFNSSDVWVDVFTMGEAGYYCIKIPSLMTTLNGTLIALGEGRRISCSDYTWTDLVFKRSVDGGRTWSELQLLHSNSTSNDQNVIGNAAPVQLRENGRILVPFCRNNLEVWIIYSDDDGLTWSEARQIDGVVDETWQWVGTGPPASIQLESGRVVTPSYHSNAPHWTDGEITQSHLMYSDDGGDTWVLGAQLSTFRYLTSECQLAPLSNGSLLLNARGILPRRLQALSEDGGESFGAVTVMPEPLIEPLEGCEGSTVRHSETGMLFFTIPNNPSPLRYNVSVFTSSDDASSWQFLKVIEEGRSAYSTLSELKDHSMGLLFERSNLTDVVFVPQAITFTLVWP